MKFTIQRWDGTIVVTEMGPNLDHETTKGIVMLLWGEMPKTLETGGKVGEEWKLSFGGGHWVIIARTA